ncbi:MAG: ABC transporter permease [Candidatus Sericytochromatia bacterium]
MNPAKYVGMAFEALILNKVRSALTMLGIVIGVLAVIVMVGLGQASQAYITSQVQGLGAGVLIVTPGNPKTQNAFGPPGTTSAQTLKLSDVRPLETLPGVRFVSPQAFISTTFQVGRNTAGGQAVGTGANFQELRGVTLSEGRFFNEQETRTGAKVAVIGHKLAVELFKDTLKRPLESRIEVNDQRLRVVGVLTEQGSGLFGSVDNQVFMPTRTFQSLLKGGERLNSILIKAESEAQLAALQPQVSALLRQRHGIRPDEEDDFKLQTQADLLKTVTTVTQVFTLLLAGIAAISLLVGGIGIMNIMLVTVTERTREIGVRKAVGAKRRDILIQFLIEGAVISLAGGTIGITLGLALTWVITRAAGLPFVLSPAAVIGGFAFSVAVGIFFGLYPANKAASLAPVDALRYE